MAEMTDPHDGLLSFQEALRGGRIAPIACELHPDLYVLKDFCMEGARLTYALIEMGLVKATAVYVVSQPIEGIQCFAIGYAVAKPFRNQGLANVVLEKSVTELRHGLRKKLHKFYVEAIVGVSNIPSQRVAERFLSASPRTTNENISGQPAFAYCRLFD